MKLTELFSDESKWIKGTSAKTVQGWFIPPESSLAVCWCLIGAIARCYRGDVEEHAVRYKVAMYLINERKQANGAIAPWNDSDATTFADVKALVERLAI